MNKALSQECKISQAITVTNGAAGTTAINGAIIDMAGYDGLLILVTFGAIVATAVTSIKAQQGEASNLSDAADLLGTGQTIADTDDEKTFYIDIPKPRERYIRLVVSRGTANATVADALYIQYRKRSTGAASHGTNVAGELHTAEAEGTA